MRLGRQDLRDARNSPHLRGQPRFNAEPYRAHKGRLAHGPRYIHRFPIHVNIGWELILTRKPLGSTRRRAGSPRNKRELTRDQHTPTRVMPGCEYQKNAPIHESGIGTVVLGIFLDSFDSQGGAVQKPTSSQPEDLPLKALPATRPLCS